MRISWEFGNKSQLNETCVFDLLPTLGFTSQEKNFSSKMIYIPFGLRKPHRNLLLQTVALDRPLKRLVIDSFLRRRKMRYKFIQ